LIYVLRLTVIFVGTSLARTSGSSKSFASKYIPNKLFL
jgi:hypothetical protein